MHDYQTHLSANVNLAHEYDEFSLYVRAVIAMKDEPKNIVECACHCQVQHTAYSSQLAPIHSQIVILEAKKKVSWIFYGRFFSCLLAHTETGLTWHSVYVRYGHYANDTESGYISI